MGLAKYLSVDHLSYFPTLLIWSGFLSTDRLLILIKKKKNHCQLKDFCCSLKQGIMLAVSNLSHSPVPRTSIPASTRLGIKFHLYSQGYTFFERNKGGLQELIYMTFATTCHLWHRAALIRNKGPSLALCLYKEIAGDFRGSRSGWFAPSCLQNNMHCQIVC